MAEQRIPGFRLGIYIFKDAEIVDFAAPYGVFSVARRFDPELEAFLIADANRPVQAQAGFTVLPNYLFNDRPGMNAFLIPGGFGTRQETRNQRLHEFIRSLPDSCLLTSVCTGSWVYGVWASWMACRPPTGRSLTARNPYRRERCRSIDWLSSLRPVGSAALGLSMLGGSSPRAALRPEWRWASTSSAVRATLTIC